MLITSGYTDGGLGDDTLDAEGDDAEGIHFLSKPCSRRTLAEGITVAIALAPGGADGDAVNGRE